MTPDPPTWLALNGATSHLLKGELRMGNKCCLCQWYQVHKIFHKKHLTKCNVSKTPDFLLPLNKYQNGGRFTWSAVNFQPQRRNKPPLWLIVSARTNYTLEEKVRNGNKCTWQLLSGCFFYPKQYFELENVYRWWRCNSSRATRWACVAFGIFFRCWADKQRANCIALWPNLVCNHLWQILH